MARSGKVNAARILRHRVYGSPRVAIAIKDRPRKGPPRSAAEAFLKSVAGDLDVDPDLRDLRFDKVIESPLGRHVLFQQYDGDKPITGAWLRVDLDDENRVYHLNNSTVPTHRLAGRGRPHNKPMLTEAAAKKKALSALKAIPSRVRADISAELVTFPGEKRLEPAWKFLIPLREPSRDWRIYINARTGSVLFKEDMMKKSRGTGTVFDPNPVVALDDTTLRDSASIPPGAYREVDLFDLASTGYLDGPYVSTARTKRRVRVKDRAFSFNRKQPGFKEVMVYFHIDRVQRYLQSLGFESVNRRPIAVDIAGSKQDNSQYSPIEKTLSFGTGGVDDAEDAEVIVHEYGHSIQDAQVPGFGKGDEAGAMGEGFGDYLAASVFEGMKPARLKACIASWDATAYSKDDPPCLRRLDTTKHYPEDIERDVHHDGEIWSACLWQIRGALGRALTDRLVIGHHYLLQRDATFENAAEALIEVDRRLNDGAHESLIRDVFVRRGILAGSRRQRRARRR
jgi:hypothetical protein